VAELFASARIVDCIIALMLLELGVLTIVRSRTHRGMDPIELAVSLTAGMSLLFALRAALIGLSWLHVAMWLVLALIAHVLYVKLRWGAH
jgi:hypothetical protein